MKKLKRKHTSFTKFGVKSYKKLIKEWSTERILNTINNWIDITSKSQDEKKMRTYLYHIKLLNKELSKRCEDNS